MGLFGHPVCILAKLTLVLTFKIIRSTLVQTYFDSHGFHKNYSDQFLQYFTNQINSDYSGEWTFQMYSNIPLGASKNAAEGTICDRSSSSLICKERKGKFTEGFFMNKLKKHKFLISMLQYDCRIQTIPPHNSNS